MFRTSLLARSRFVLPSRTFSPASSHIRRYNHTASNALPPTSFADPSRPDLYYHLITPATSKHVSSSFFGLSFLPSAPKTLRSPTVIGWLPAEGDAEPGLNDFEENPEFRKLLHSAILDALKEGIDETQLSAARQLENGWMHIRDERNPPLPVRVGDPDDIIATVLVEDAQIITDTYSPMPAYRVCTGDGVTQLTDGLARKLKERLVAQNEKDIED